MQQIYLVTFLFLVSCAHSSNSDKSEITSSNKSKIEQAQVAAGIQATDSVESKVKKTLKLINQDRYYYPTSGTPQKLPPPFDNPYHLDSLRTPNEILTQKIGGYCGSAASVFSAMLQVSGIPSADIRIVAAVYSQDFNEICLKKNKPRVENPKTGARGHVFVAVRFSENGWRLINTIDGTNYESVPWHTPEEVEQKIALSPLTVPYEAYQKFPEHLRSLPMIVFQSWSPDTFPLHTFDQRLDLIASGEIANANDLTSLRKVKICRYGIKDVEN